MLDATDLLLWGIIVHLIADWPFQTEWMALNKTALDHPAAWIHSGIHLVGMMLIFPWYLAILIAISHLLIDTRKPVDWWMRVVKKMSRSGPHAFVVETGLDQVFHIMILVFVVLVF